MRFKDSTIPVDATLKIPRILSETGLNLENQLILLGIIMQFSTSDYTLRKPVFRDHSRSTRKDSSPSSYPGSWSPSVNQKRLKPKDSNLSSWLGSWSSQPGKTQTYLAG